MISNNWDQRFPIEVSEILTKIVEEKPEDPGLDAIIVTGSFARGDFTGYSDLDVVLFYGEIPPGTTTYDLYYDNKQLVSLSKTTIADWENLRTDPDNIGMIYHAIKDSIILFDPQWKLKHLKDTTPEDPWVQLEDSRLEKINEHAVGFIEEVHKLFSGIEKRDESTVLNALWGLIYGMMKIKALDMKLLFVSENEYFKVVQEATGIDSKWSRLLRVCLGEGDTSISQRAKAGLELYKETMRTIDASGGNQETIKHTLELINRFL